MLLIINLLNIFFIDNEFLILKFNLMILENLFFDMKRYEIKKKIIFDMRKILNYYLFVLVIIFNFIKIKY